MDNTLDYSIKVNAGQLLAERFKKYDETLDPIEAREHGFFNLYFNQST